MACIRPLKSWTNVSGSFALRSVWVAIACTTESVFRTRWFSSPMSSRCCSSQLCRSVMSIAAPTVLTARRSFPSPSKKVWDFTLIQRISPVSFSNRKTCSNSPVPVGSCALAIALRNASRSAGWTAMIASSIVAVSGNTPDQGSGERSTLPEIWSKSKKPTPAKCAAMARRSSLSFSCFSAALRPVMSRCASRTSMRSSTCAGSMRASTVTCRPSLVVWTTSPVHDSPAWSSSRISEVGDGNCDASNL